MKEVHYNGATFKMELKTITDFITHNNLRVIVNKTNGYSHDWQEIENMNADNLAPHHIFLTDQPTGRVFGSSTVSFT